MKNLIQTLTLVGILSVAGSAHSQPVTLSVNTSSSSLFANICLNPDNLGTQCSHDQHNLEGYVTVLLDNNQTPTAIELQDFHLQSPSVYNFSMSWVFGLESAHLTAGQETNIQVWASAPIPQTASYPISGNAFTAVNVPINIDGWADYTASGILAPAAA